MACDGIIDAADTDSDNDGIPDAVEAGANPSSPLDSDGDGIIDVLDLDSDNDGVVDATEGTVDSDGDGVVDRLDLDSDNDGVFDLVENGVVIPVDADGDGRLEGDVGANGLGDTLESTPDSEQLLMQPVDSDNDC